MTSGGGGAYFYAPVRLLAACGHAGADECGALAFPVAFAPQGGCYWAVPVLPAYFQANGLVEPHWLVCMHKAQQQQPPFTEVVKRVSADKCSALLCLLTTFFPSLSLCILSVTRSSR